MDGQWRHAGDLPTELDEWGNINNVVHVGANGVELGGGTSHTDIYGARSYGRMFWHTVRAGLRGNLLLLARSLPLGLQMLGALFLIVDRPIEFGKVSDGSRLQTTAQKLEVGGQNT